jgi:hypothetical protein
LKEEKRRTFLHQACLPWLGIDSYRVENNKCSSFAQVFPDFGNIDGVLRAVDTD